jgi:hypothetical protein
MALSPAYEKAWESEIRWVIGQHPKYLYGGNSLESGIDCSRMPHLTATKAGMTGLQRLTADDIFSGADGWKGKNVDINDAGRLDMLFWIWQKKDSLRLSNGLTLTDNRKKRKIDHMGIVLLGKKSGLFEVAHMSSSKGGVIEPFGATMKRDCVGVRRLTIGD